ncbi:phosphoglycerate dehydrogenase-like enzyme [Neobacillus niacini]|uniref:D-2-hydroxyacid dehydrogenase n=1 Tax=Neobacillus niacini TaxID=86668 RepID=UPI00285614B8|nr:D-2-hydroxyacid dehydrogenase [Neobacillus niacini]MDR7077073.1 phosphoglycerate dehydrogenase-like enzyme [Neobacillus niacini]
MDKRKIVITHDLDQNLINQIKEVIPDWNIIIGKDEDIWQEHLHDAEIIAGWKKGIEEVLLSPNSKLKWLQTWSAGVNNLPLESLESRNIIVTSANGVHAYPISETIFAFMLGLTRKIHTYVNNQQARKWHHSGMKLEMHEKTVGIIGVGTIGKEVAKISKAFGMKVLGVRHSGKQQQFVDEMYTTNQLNEILPSCDYVVVTLPLTKETHRLFGSKQFDLMKSSAFFINIGRGEIVNEEALIHALREGIIAGAGLDVFEREPLSVDSPLWDMENVIITPHTSGSTEHYNQRVIKNILIPNLKDYISGVQPSVNLVDFSKGY